MDIYHVLLVCTLIVIASSRNRVLQWSEWSDLSSCFSLNCTDKQAVPFEFQFRWCLSRTKQMCQGPHLLAKSCSQNVNCPVDGQWSSWGEWQCNKIRQIATRTRVCNNPSPKNGGRECNSADGIQLLERQADEERFFSICKMLKGDSDYGNYDYSGSGGSGDYSGDNGLDQEEDDDWSR